MPRLVSRSRFCPPGWIFHHGSQPAPIVARDFSSLVESIIAFRKGNPFITAQNKLSTDRKAVEDEADSYIASVCLSRPDWAEYATASGGPSAPFSLAPAQALRRFQSGAGAVAGAVRKTVAGISLIREWIGDGLRPVENELAEKRASICSTCPQNGEPNFIEKLSSIVAAEIKTLMQTRSDLKLQTSFDDNLHSCKACTCALKLKVFSPIDLIIKNTDEALMAKLSEVKPPNGGKCWVVAEAKKE